MVEFIGVTKKYENGVEAIANIDLKIEKGEFVFIVGPSGSGKSTLLRLMRREILPNEGTVIINGQNLRTIRKHKIPYFRRQLGIVFQDFRLIDKMTVYENVAFAMRVIGLSGKRVRERVSYVLKLVKLTEKSNCYPHELSGGEQQRVGLARALVNNPEVLIADEPTGNIDPDLSLEIIDMLREINDRGTTIIVVTHEHSLVQKFHKRIIEINNGSKVADTKDIEK